MRSGSLVDVNQLSALQRPRVLSSLQTNPVRGAAAERCCGPESNETETQPDAHRSLRRHGEKHSSSADIKTIVCREKKKEFTSEKEKKEARRRTQSEKNAKKSSNVFLGECVRKEEGKRREQIKRSVCERRKHSPPALLLFPLCPQ